jgi:hypothetical protein
MRQRELENQFDEKGRLLADESKNAKGT